VAKTISLIEIDAVLPGIGSQLLEAVKPYLLGLADANRSDSAYFD